RRDPPSAPARARRSTCAPAPGRQGAASPRRNASRQPFRHARRRRRNRPGPHPIRGTRRRSAPWTDPACNGTPLAGRADPGMCLAIPGEVLEIHESDGVRFAEVRFGGVTRRVCLAYEPDAQPGEFVLVHVGFAIARVDAEEAARTWRVLDELCQLDEVAP